MPKPANWREVGVASDLPRLYTEHELTQCLGLSTYGLYHLRRLGVVAPMARNKRSLLYDSSTANELIKQRRQDANGRWYVLVLTEEGAKGVY